MTSKDFAKEIGNCVMRNKPIVQRASELQSDLKVDQTILL